MATDPDLCPFTGYVETTMNALRLIYAAREGVIPRITRRLDESERKSMVRSGSVFIFNVEESGIRRWTDGLSWSPSRILGNFLVYKEINTTSPSARRNHLYHCDKSRAIVRKSSPDQTSVAMVGHSRGQKKIKVGGLVKKTITVNVDDLHFHLISYYTLDDIRSGKLKRPHSRVDIMSLRLPPESFDLVHFRVPLKIEIGPDGKSEFWEREEDDPDDVPGKVEDHGNELLVSYTPAHTPSPTEEHMSPCVGSPERTTDPTTEGWAPSHISPVHHEIAPQSQIHSAPTSNYITSHRRQSGLVSYTPAHTPSPTEEHMSPCVGSPERTTDPTTEGWAPSLISPVHHEIAPQSQIHSAPTSNYITSHRRQSGPVQLNSWTSTNRQWQHNSMTSHSSTDDACTDQLGGHYGLQQEGGGVVKRVYYAAHPIEARETALQRLHWQPHDASHRLYNLQKAAEVTSQVRSSCSSPTPAPFAPREYCTIPTYDSSWVQADGNITARPTLPSATQRQLLSRGTYALPMVTVPSSENGGSAENYHKT